MNEILKNKCRICGAQNLHEIVVLKNMPLTDEFVTKDRIGKEYSSDIKIGICGDCGVTQNLNDVNLDNYYNEYEYSVGSSKFANFFMDILAKRIKKNFYEDYSSPTVLEIGSGSGEQLKMFKKYGFSVIGVEPSEYLASYANSNNTTTIKDFFYTGMINKIKKISPVVDCIVSSYTFDHIPYLIETFDAINSILSPDGKLIIEVHDLDLILHRKEFCLFEHEHYIYLNKITAENLFKKNGFKIITFNLLNTKEKRGNSLLIVAQKTNIKSPIEIDVKKEIEKVKNINIKIQNTINKIDNWIEDNKNKKIVAYGAGGRGIMTLSALEKYKNFEFIVDQNPKGKKIFSPKTHLPIYKPEILKTDKADLIFVFSYGYFEEIVESLSLYGYTKDQFVSLLDFI